MMFSCGFIEDLVVVYSYKLVTFTWSAEMISVYHSCNLLS